MSTLAEKEDESQKEVLYKEGSSREGRTERKWLAELLAGAEKSNSSVIRFSIIDQSGWKRRSKKERGELEWERRKCQAGEELLGEKST